MSDSPVFRTIEGPTDLERFLGLPYSLNPELADDLRLGRRRTEWMWMALIDDSVVHRDWHGGATPEKTSLHCWTSSTSPTPAIRCIASPPET